ncbi:hypothetical protein IRY55_07435 [Savagea sp. SN6]|uniref:Uncharacterized protein n=1 Tax=Savagea serpentis TaxID=2785297 RepID=A0A8J7KEI5_9BACL|nr:hypothetical protein [Savagea serpentis]MBF4501191.1 hypothetical protein [Savagea serpentis]
MATEMIGFDSQPFAIVVWLKDGEEKYKTICYSKDEVYETTRRSRIEGDFYFGKDYFIIQDFVMLKTCNTKKAPPWQERNVI